MTNVFIQQAFEAFAVATSTARTELVRALAKQGVTTWEDAQPHAQQWVAKKYGVRLVAGERKAAGTLVLDRNAKNYETAKKALQRLREALVGIKVKPAVRNEVDDVTRALNAFKKLNATQRNKFLKLAIAMK